MLVIGGDVGVINGMLMIMVGGDILDFEEVLFVFKFIGEKIVYCGFSGSG